METKSLLAERARINSSKKFKTQLKKTLEPELTTLTKDDEKALIDNKNDLNIAFLGMSKVLDEGYIETEVSSSVYNCVRRIMLSAFYAGAICAISDSAREFLQRPFKEGGAKTGRKRGEQLAAEADLRWRNEARRLYSEFRGNSCARRLTQEKLADRIEAEIPNAPNHRQIVDFIRSLDRS